MGGVEVLTGRAHRENVLVGGVHVGHTPEMTDDGEEEEQEQPMVSESTLMQFDCNKDHTGHDPCIQWATPHSGQTGCPV